MENGKAQARAMNSALQVEAGQTKSDQSDQVKPNPTGSNQIKPVCQSSAVSGQSPTAGADVAGEEYGDTQDPSSQGYDATGSNGDGSQ